MSRKYRKKSALSSIIKDTAYITSKMSWKGSLILGFVLFILFYFLLPSLINNNQTNSGHLQGVVDIVISRHVHKVQWLGIVCGLLGVFFAIKNYFFNNNTTYKQRSFISFLAKLVGRQID